MSCIATHEVMNVLISTVDTTPEGIVKYETGAEVRGQTDIRGQGEKCAYQILVQP